MTADNPRPTFDVSCPTCMTGWWVTSPDEFAWTGCEDCRDEEFPVFTEEQAASLSAENLPTFVPRPAARGAATVLGVGMFAALVLLAVSVAWAIGWTRGAW